MDEIIKVFENNHVEPPWSHILVLGLDALAIFAVVWCVREILEARRAAKQAQNVEQSPKPLFDGARFVTGRVELADGSDKAIRVTIIQQGTERTYKNQQSHTWTEIERSIEAAPFYIRTAQGERVRVEPPSDVQLVDQLDQMEWHSVTQRRRRAELTPGESAVIEGRLERGPDPEDRGSNTTYRHNAATGWIMKPTKRRGMSISTESLSRRHELRARAFTKTAIAVVLLGLCAATILAPYRIRVLLGKNVVATYGGRVRNEFHSGRNGRFVRYEYNVSVAVMDDPEHIFTERMIVDEKDFYRLPDKKNGRIWIRYVPGKPWASALGLGTSVNGPLTLLSAAFVGLGVLIVLRTKRRRRWYEGHLVDHGQGSLPVPTNECFREKQIDWPPKPHRPVAQVADRISAEFTKEPEQQD